MVYLNTVAAMLMMIINSAYQRDTNYYIALKLLTSYFDLDDLTASSLTYECGTSVAYINKFSKMLGFKSFSDLKFNLKNGYQIRKVQMKERISSMSEDEILENISYLSKNQLDKELFQAQIQNLLTIIKDAKEVQLIGAYYPTALCVNFQEDMLTMGKLVRIYPQTYHFRIDEESKGLAILITLTGRIYEYNKTNFENVVKTHDSIAIISGYEGYPKIPTLKSFVKIPIHTDSEIGNLMIVEIFRYIKYMYYKYVYGEK